MTGTLLHSAFPNDRAPAPGGCRIVVIGGGLVGLATARAVNLARPDAHVSVLEKEDAVATHQSGRNSGVLHAGLYYRPGSAKAQLAVSGIRRMVEYCGEKEIPFDQCGKLVVAVDRAETEMLRVLEERGRANGLSGLRWMSGAEAREIEPEVRCVAALHVPEEGIVNYRAVAGALAADVRHAGSRVMTSTAFHGAVQDGAGWMVTTSRGDLPASLIINCAGLQADRVAASLGARDIPAIVPFRGDYFKLRPACEHLVRNLIYPVPDPAFPFLGVHFTRMINGGVECGPSAVLAMKREGYGRFDFSARDSFEAFRYPGLLRFTVRHVGAVTAELWRSASRKAFTQALRKLVPAVGPDDLEQGGAGVRAQAMTRDGRLVEDFAFAESHRALHVINAPSPAATASLEIGRFIAERAMTMLHAHR